MEIKDLIMQISDKMKSDLEMARSSLNHPGLKGDSAEITFREFLKNYLPKTLEICTGIVIDSKGNSSKQIDVIISDNSTPIFYSKGKNRVLPVECVFSVIEIKTVLNKKELESTFKNMKSVRKLNKMAYYESKGPIINEHCLYGQKWTVWPINYFIFAYESIKPEKLLHILEKEHGKEKMPPHSRIDCVCILDKGVICNQSHGNIDALPSNDSKLVYIESEVPLLLFYTLISHYLNQTRHPNFKFLDYLNGLNLGSIKKLE